HGARDLPRGAREPGRGPAPADVPRPAVVPTCRGRRREDPRVRRLGTSARIRRIAPGRLGTCRDLLPRGGRVSPHYRCDPAPRGIRRPRPTVPTIPPAPREPPAHAQSGEPAAGRVAAVPSRRAGGRPAGAA